MKFCQFVISFMMMINSLFGTVYGNQSLKIPVILDAETNKAIVYVTLQKNSDATEYIFQYPGTKPNEDSYDWLPITNLEDNTFHCFKYDGEYDVYVRNDSHIISNEVHVTVDSGYHYTYDSQNVTGLKYPLSVFLETKNTSVEAMNQYIENEIMEAGWQTREGVAISALSTISFLAGYGTGIPYQSFGSYQGENDWGVNPKWGEALCEPLDNGTGPDYYLGMQCVGACIWAFKQAGISLNNPNVKWEIGKCGETNYIGSYKWASDNIIDYRKARTGDLVQINSHYRTIMDRVDTDGDGTCDAYLSFEMHKVGAEGTLTCRIVPMYTLSYGNDRKVFNMDNVYAGEGHQQKWTTFWKSSLIPYEALPDYIKAVLRVNKSSSEPFKTHHSANNTKLL